MPPIRTITNNDSGLMGDMPVKFVGLFVTLTMLRLVRSCDHRIQIPHDINPFSYGLTATRNLRRMRSSASATRCLGQGIIHPSDSTFSSPILFIKNHDYSWHFYVNYQVLNEHTMKDEFWIHVVNEL